MHEHANPTSPAPEVVTPTVSAAAPAVPAPLRSLSRAGALRGGGASLARAAVVNGMQGRYGNAVVARAAMLARQGNERAEKLAAFNAAKGKDWGLAAEILNGFDDADIQRLLGGLSKQQLRELDAGAMRRIPSFAATIPPTVDSGQGAISGAHMPSRASSACSSASGVPAPTVT